MNNKFSNLLPYAGMVDNGIIITKDAMLLRTFKVFASDFTHADYDQINTSLRNLNTAFRLLGEGWGIWIDSIRSKCDNLPEYFHHDAPPKARAFDADRKHSLGVFYQTDFYVSFCLNIGDKKGLSSVMFKSSKEDSINYDLEEFKNVTDDVFNIFNAAFADIKRLNSSELLTFLHSLFGENHPVKMPEIPFYLDVFLSDALFIPDTVTKINDDYIQVASIHDFPTHTHASTISALMQQPEEFRVSTRFIFLGKEKARGEIKKYRQAHFQKRKGIGSIFSEAVMKEQTELQDTEALAMTGDSSEALSLLAAQDVAYGYLTSTFIVRGSDYTAGKNILKNIKKIINEQGFIVKEESFNTPNAFLGSLPGVYDKNPRKPLVSTRNLAHFFPVSDRWCGDFSNSHIEELTGVKFPHMITKAGYSPFYLNLNVGDVGHTLVIGPTGAGKSILLNTLALQWMRYPQSRVVFFDKDKSSKPACSNVGGTFYDMGDNGCELKMNPFGELKDKDHRIWLSKFLTAFLSQKVSISPKDETEIYQTLESMASMDIESLSFNTFQNTIQEKDIRHVLQPFVDGEYTDLFMSGGQDNIESFKWVTFEMNKLMQRGDDIVTFVLGYLFQKLNNLFTGTPTLLILDEAWLFLSNDYFVAMLRDWLKTLRKKNVYVILATQEIQDTKSNIFSTILNACMTKILLPNSQAMQDENRDLYQGIGISNDDIAALAEATPKRQYFYFSPKGKQMFNLMLSDVQLRFLKELL